MIRDGIGLYGSLVNYTFLFALFGSTALVLFYIWRKGLLNMGEDSKYKMMDQDEEEFHL